MKLRYIKFFMNTHLSDRIYGSHFDFHVYVFWHFLSIQVRRLKFETDGTFNAVCIEVGVEPPSVELDTCFQNFKVSLPFDFGFYDNATQDQKYKYYVELIREGLQIASEHKNIPLKELNSLLTELADNNFIYTWDFKNLRVPEYNLKIKFTCQLTTDDFILKMQAFRNKETEPVCEGTVIRTMPDSIFFSGISKDIQVKNGRISINKYGDEMLTIRLKSIIEGNLIIDYSSNPYPDDPLSSSCFNTFQKSLRYDNYEFK